MTTRAQARDRGPVPRGRLEVRVYRRGVLVDAFVEENLIVNGIKERLAKLLGGATAADHVTQIAFGSSGVVPAAGDVRPLADEFKKAIGAVAYPVAGKVQFDWTLDAAEANGLAIREWGLVTQGNVLVARKSRVAPIAKEADVTLEGSWIIDWT